MIPTRYRTNTNNAPYDNFRGRVNGTLDAGLGFTIDEKVTVNGSSQYKVHNSKGNTYYITASDAYVNAR